jgi:hypothetical protein
MNTAHIDRYVSALRRMLRTRGVADARIADEAREHLFDAINDGIECGLSAEAAERAAFERFGDPDALAQEFARVYRWDYFAWYLAKIAASVVAAVAVALILQVIFNLRVVLESEAVQLAPSFSKAAIRSVAIVLGLATAWEIGRRPFALRRAAIALGAYVAVCLGAQVLFAQGLEAFGPATLLVGVGWLCTRLERRPARLLLTFSLFVAAIVAIHRMLNITVSAAGAASSSAALIAIWISTITIFVQCDRWFASPSSDPPSASPR